MVTGSRLLFFLFLGAVWPCYANVITVGQAQQWPTIQAAIEAAKPGDTLQVHPGTYREGNILVRKPLCFIGIGYPVIDGEGKYELFTVASTDVTIRGFRLINTGSASINDIAAIKGLDVQRMKILDNQFEETFFGIHLSNSTQTLIEGNTLRGTSGARAEQDVGNGIHLWKCDHITVRKNAVTSHRDGIYFEFVTRSIVEENYSHQNLRYGLHFMFSHEDEYHRNIFRNNGSGVAIMYTRGVTMTGNLFENNQGAASYALLLKDISDSRIEGCQFRNNTVGIYMEGSSRCVLMNNEFRENGWALKIQASCDNNTLTRNNFVRNTFDVATNGSLSLNTLSSNYWDKYEGYDINRDGVGDVPFHPVSLYGMIVERMPTAVLLWRSFLVFLLDRAEKVVPAVTPENLKDEQPAMRSYDRG
jgi:nitrous oxidase accessory protein